MPPVKADKPSAPTALPKNGIFFILDNILPALKPVPAIPGRLLPKNVPPPKPYNAPAVRAILPASDLIKLPIPLATPLIAFLRPPKNASSLGTIFIIPPPIRNCLSIIPLDIGIINKVYIKNSPFTT